MRSVFSLTARSLIYSSSALSPPSAQHFPTSYLHHDYHKSVSGEVRTGHRVASVTYGLHKSPQRSQREQMDKKNINQGCGQRKRLLVKKWQRVVITVIIRGKGFSLGFSFNCNRGPWSGFGVLYPLMLRLKRCNFASFLHLSGQFRPPSL